MVWCFAGGLGEPMTTPQSQQELRRQVFLMLCKLTEADDEDHNETENEVLVTDAILALITTHNKKLLAAVREIIGEPSDDDSNGRYNLKVEQRKQLDAIEGEM